MGSVDPQVALNHLAHFGDVYQQKQQAGTIQLDIRSILTTPEEAIVSKRGILQQIRDWFLFWGTKTLKQGEVETHFAESAHSRKSNNRILEKLFQKALSVEKEPESAETDQGKKIAQAVHLALAHDKVECLKILREHVSQQIEKTPTIEKLHALTASITFQELMHEDPEETLKTVVSRLTALGSTEQDQRQLIQTYKNVFHLRWEAAISRVNGLEELKHQIDEDLSRVQPEELRPLLQIQKSATLLEAQAIFDIPRLLETTKAFIEELRKCSDKEAAFVTLELIMPSIREIAMRSPLPELIQCKESLEKLVHEPASHSSTLSKTTAVARGIFGFFTSRQFIYGCVSGAVRGIGGGLSGMVAGGVAGAIAGGVLKLTEKPLEKVAEAVGKKASEVAEKVQLPQVVQNSAYGAAKEITKMVCHIMLSNILHSLVGRVVTRRPPP